MMLAIGASERMKKSASKVSISSAPSVQLLREQRSEIAAACGEHRSHAFPVGSTADYLKRAGLARRDAPSCRGGPRRLRLSKSSLNNTRVAGWSKLQSRHPEHLNVIEIDLAARGPERLKEHLLEGLVTRDRDFDIHPILRGGAGGRGLYATCSASTVSARAPAYAE